MSDRDKKIVQLFKKAGDTKRRTEVDGVIISQSVNHGSGNIQAGGDVNIITERLPTVKILPPIKSIGGDPLLKKAIQDRFTRLADARAVRFDKKNAYKVMYINFKRDFNIKGKLEQIWLWPREAAETIIRYLDEKYANTIQGKIEKAAERPGYIPTRRRLYQMEKALLAHFDLQLNSAQVKDDLQRYFAVRSHRQLTYEQHWRWVMHLKNLVDGLEEY